MPKMNGLDMLEKLRGDTWGSSANVILLTVLEDVESVSRALQHGVKDYFVKTDRDLKDIIQRVREKVGA
jgi:YesN/AraC family two-component response regulator